MLYGFNKTAADVDLAAGNPIRTLPLSADPPNRGTPLDLTSELKPSKTVDPVNGVDGGLELADYSLLEAQRVLGEIDFVWDGFPEYNTGSLVVGGAPLSADEKAALAGSAGTPSASNPYLTEADERLTKLSTAAREYWVDTVAGDDSNDGLSDTPGAGGVGPWKTFNRAIAVLAQIGFKHPFVLHAPGDHTLGPVESVLLSIFDRNDCVIDGGDGLTVVLDNGGSPFTADASSLTSIGYSGLALTPNTLKGEMLRVYTGPGAGIWTVSTHDGSNFSPCTEGREFPADPGLVQFDIVRPSSTITVNGAPFSFDASTRVGKWAVSGEGTLWIQRFTLAGNLPFTITKGGVKVAACVIDKGAQLGVGNLWRWEIAYARDNACGFYNTPRDPAVMGGGSDLAGNFAGVGVVGGPASIYFNDGLVQWCGGFVNFYGAVGEQLTCNSCPGAGVRVREGSTFANTQIGNGKLDLVVEWEECYLGGFRPFGYPFPTLGGITAINGGVTLGNNVDISNAVDPIYARGSDIRIEGKITGTGNSGFCIKAPDGSSIQFENGTEDLSGFSASGGEISLDGFVAHPDGFAGAQTSIGISDPWSGSVANVRSQLSQEP